MPDEGRSKLIRLRKEMAALEPRYELRSPGIQDSRPSTSGLTNVNNSISIPWNHFETKYVQYFISEVKRLSGDETLELLRK